MTESRRAGNVNHSKRAILFDLLQRRVTVDEVIAQKLFTSESEICDAIVKLIDEAQRYRYTNKIEPQLSRRQPEPVISYRSATNTDAVNPVSAFHRISDKSPSQADFTQGSKSERQKLNQAMAVKHDEPVSGLFSSNILHSLSDFQMFIVEKIRELKLTLQTALDAEIFAFAGMDELTLAEQGAMISDNAGNYIGATKLSEEMNMIHTQGRGNHIADGGVANDIQSEHNQEKTRRFLKTQKNHEQFEHNQDKHNQDKHNKMRANGKPAPNKYGNIKTTATDEQQRQALIDTLNYTPPTPRNTR